jgi:hypothetical protein
LVSAIKRLGAGCLNLNAADVSCEGDLIDLTAPCIATAPEACKDGIPVGQLGRVGGDAKQLLAFIHELAEKSLDPKAGRADSLLIAHEGKLIVESFFRRSRIDYPHYHISITKSYPVMAITLHQAMPMTSRIRLDREKVALLRQQPKRLKGQGQIQVYLEHSAPIPYRGYKFSIYEGGLRVPKITRWAGVIS